MTLQVGMLATDGVILAGDTRLNRKPLEGFYAPWQHYDGPKIQISESGRIAVSCAHDMQAAKDFANAIFANMTHGDHSTCEREIRTIGSDAVKGQNVECLIAFSDPLPSLYLFQHTTNRDTVHCDCQRIISCISTGDAQNPASFWGMSYYDLLPVDQLKNLAACMVVAAGQLNSSIIGGFELLLCTKDGCIRMPNDQARELQTEARAKIERIRQFILDPKPL